MIDQTGADAMQCLNVLLFFGFSRDELHVRLHERCAERFSVVAVVFLMLDERLHMLWCDDFDGVSQIFELA